MLVTKKAPFFSASAVMPNGTIKENFSINEAMGTRGLIIFFWPKDFTFVCPSEIIAFDNKLSIFKEKGFNVVGISADSDYVHLAWRNTDVSKGGIGQVGFPLVSDIKKQIARDYDVLFDDSVALRGSFLIDKDQIVRHAVINDMPLGRNIDEMVRMVDALIFFETHGEVCPANWKKGEKGMKATPDGVASYLSENKNKL